MDVVGATAALKVADEIQRKKDSEKAAKEAMKVITISKGDGKAVKGDVSKRPRESKVREKKADSVAVTVLPDVDLSGEDSTSVLAGKKHQLSQKPRPQLSGRKMSQICLKLARSRHPQCARATVSL